VSSSQETLGARTLSERLGFQPAVVELGATHPGVRRVTIGTGGTIAFLVTLDDDRIESLEVEIGQGHRGFEKEIETRPWVEALPYVGRLGYASGPIAQVAYCLALEALIDLPVPERATWLRTLVVELARATDHLARVAAVAGALGAAAAESASRRAELAAAKLLEAALGAGPLEPWSFPGGVARDLPPGFDADFSARRAALEADLARAAFFLLDHPSALARLVDVAPLAGPDARALGVTGPCLRASGVARDLRRDSPCLAYAELDFDVPVGTRGDDWDRLAVVVEEIRQSLRIAGQCLARIPALGPDVVAAEATEASEATEAAGKRAAGARARGAAAAGGLAIRVPRGERAFAFEGSTGELEFLLASDGGDALPRRIRVRAPSFFHAQALPALLVGARLDDLLPTAALFHLVSGECDR